MSENRSAATDLAQGAEGLLPPVERDLARIRRRVLELRAELRVAEDEQKRLRDLQRSLRAIVNGGDVEDDPDDAEGGLVGWRVGEAALDVLRGRGEPMHYRDVWHEMEASGIRIESEDPEAVVLTQLTRHPDVVRASRGMYGVRDA